MIPYGRQSITEEDIEAVLTSLKSDFLTQGPIVPTFERAVADCCGAGYAVAVNSATAALHLAYLALGLRPGDVLWTTPITFVATSNAALFCGAHVDFVDVEPDSGNLSVFHLEEKLRNCHQQNLPLPKVVVPVHLAGLSCDMERIHQLSLEYGFKIVEDASHAIGGEYRGDKVGSCRYSDITIFSFHPVKVMTTGEGGMALTNDPSLARRMSALRSHGITRDTGEMTEPSHGGWYYQQLFLGFNYRMTELQAALGLSQLKRLDDFVQIRNELALKYDDAFSGLPIDIPARREGVLSAFHLYSVRIAPCSTIDRLYVYNYLLSKGVGVQVHYIPVVIQPFYKSMNLYPVEAYPSAMAYYERTLSLPLFSSMLPNQQKEVIKRVKEIFVSGLAK